jgi:hypothetical protein
LGGVGDVAGELAAAAQVRFFDKLRRSPSAMGKDRFHAPRKEK